MGWSLTGVRQEHIYIAIEFLNVHKGYSIKEICLALKLNRSSYYKWKKRKQKRAFKHTNYGVCKGLLRRKQRSSRIQTDVH